MSIVQRRPRGETRAKLLDAALDAFARHGFAGASIRAITREVGVRESAFYAHFPSKRAVYDELFAEAGPAVVTRLVAELPDEGAAEQVLPALAQRILAAWATRRARAFASVAVRESFGGNAESRTALLNGIDGALRALAGRFAHFERLGTADPHVLAYEFIAPIVMARFLFFTIDASEAEMRRGEVLVAAHAASFAALLGATRDRRRPSPSSR
ncbi:MAG TPA: TetR/AcrR family transcriptional regulator [Candidatus Limnocylindria bacterium]|nr:TetR/AcrR family transcriptional regulator [Candidatus Limnocylindria bacterium]